MKRSTALALVPPAEEQVAAEQATPEESRGWLRHAEVVAWLQVDRRTLRARMAATPPHIERPWLNIGSAARPEYRWRAARIDTWWIEVHAWRASNEDLAGGASAGATPTAAPAAAPAPTSAPPSGSPGRSSRRRPRAGDGSLPGFVRSLPSKTS